MTQRLQDVVGKLYRSLAGHARQVFALSRRDAERLPRLPSVAVISVTAPGRSPANLDGFDHVLRLSFADVDFLKPDLSRKATEKLTDAFTRGHADMIRSFVEFLPEEINAIVVHCEGGYSRSCAIALGLHRLYGYNVEMEHLAHANSSILHVMTADENMAGIRAERSQLEILDDVEKGLQDALADRTMPERKFRKSLRRSARRK
ncbi:MULTISPECIES: hypothetical protein [Burkholderia]|uniref:hypothetical protein n=1 Tax=Burkholderia TaxID=32008 RepID=UPI000717ED5C|nr:MULTISPECIES: hypothetical protein [Burkholderia]MBF3450550.1 hypothetical protein [Burkholderia pseudomallei]MBF3813245.1 hypothetical protein [Burkholderia pseudomallei]MBF3843488.1 hypothetical protein [Burkholderia pseudomallei]MBN3739185.1 hypothetical protein [Burkholderia sp. Tr-20355]MCS6518409.1 hypothetical protein [Burkholderia thailandensis]